jgi:Region found in RelA / SpoT proteins
VALSKGQIDRLGDRLREFGGPGDENDRALLEQLLTEHLEVLEEAARMMGEGLEYRGIQPTPRLKSDTTIIEKVVRERGMKLSRMQDISGLRIVDDMTWVQQDDLVREIVNLFARAKVRDRREEPVSGYRAVHVIASVRGHWVEIQVRTLLQDAWAQTFERLGDTWGRQIRYGDPPNEPDRIVLGDGTRREFVADLLQLSHLLAEHEETLSEMVELEVEFGEAPEPLTDEEREVYEDMQGQLGEAIQRVQETSARFRSILESSRRVVESIVREGLD